MSSSQTVVFRCEVSPSVGIGHLMRSRTFAAALRARSVRCVMVGPADDYRNGPDATLFQDWVPVKEWTGGRDDARALVEVARRHGASRAVVDDYRADEAFQHVLAEAGLVWMQHFDASKQRRFRADMLVHGSPAETAERWRPYLDNPATEMLFGPRYAVLRDEFPPAQLRPDGRPVKRILVSFGGGDDQGLIGLTLAALTTRFPDLRIAVMSGSRNPSIESVRAWIDASAADRVELHVEPGDVAGLFAGCDLAVLGGGISVYEGAACGLPMALVALADNQLRQCAGWQDLGAATFLGPAAEMTGERIADAVGAIVADDARRGAMSALGRQAVDGKGAEKLAGHLLKDRSK